MRGEEGVLQLLSDHPLAWAFYVPLPAAPWTWTSHFFPHHLPLDVENIFAHFSSCLCVRDTAVGHLGGPGWLCVCRKVVSVGAGVAIGFIPLGGKQFPQPQLKSPKT